jgi:ferredoxin
MKMAKEFYIDDEECIACGSCAETCPDCFRYEEGMEHAQVTSFDCPEDDVQEAMDLCPVQCIHWQDE